MPTPLVFGPGANPMGAKAPRSYTPTATGKPLVFGPGASKATGATHPAAANPATEAVMSAIDILQRNPNKALQHGIALTHLRSALTELQQMPKV